MEIYQTREELRKKSIFDLKMRVTYYARVSSESDEQLNSLENQMQYYEDYIRQNTNWIFVKGYIDEGISGKDASKRENFLAMIDDAKNDKFDFIITKEITRFARNTLDSIMYTRKLLSYGVAVFFQNDNINTLDEDSELRLTIMSGIAQDELRKLSSRIKFGHKQAIKNGIVLGNSRMFGYDKNNGKLVINEPEAEMVRLIFNLYSTGEYSMKQIENILWEKGYKNHNGNKISHTTLSNTIANPKYKGYYVGNKVKIVDLFSAKQKFLPEEEWVMYKDLTGDVVPQIVEEDIWEEANKVLKKRSDDVKNRRGKCCHTNIFTGKLYCSHCGTPYYRKDSVAGGMKNNSKWICSNKIHNGAAACPSFPVYESELTKIIFEVFSINKKKMEEYIEQYIEMYKSLDNTSEVESLEKLNNTLETIQRKKQKLLEYNVSGKLTDSDFLTMNNDCLKEMQTTQMQIDEIKKFMLNNQSIEEKVSIMRGLLSSGSKEIENKKLSRSFVDKYIDKIYIDTQDDIVNIDIRLSTGLSIKQATKKSKSRTGQIFLMMCPVRHMKVTRNNRTMPNHEQKIIYNSYISI